LVGALSEAYRVEVIHAGEAPVRAFRRQRPQVVLLCASSREMGRMGAKARALKTEQRPPLVGLLAVSGLPPEPEKYLKAHLLDGLCAPVESPGAIQGFVAALLRGEAPIEGEPAPGNPLRGALRRLSGFRASSKAE
jgi:hypothetical protein